MKVYVFNDRNESRRYCVDTLDPKTSFILNPRESKIVDIETPEGSAVFFKEWDHLTLISYFEFDKQENNEKR